MPRLGGHERSYPSILESHSRIDGREGGVITLRIMLKLLYGVPQRRSDEVVRIIQSKRMSRKQFLRGICFGAKRALLCLEKGGRSTSATSMGGCFRSSFIYFRCAFLHSCQSRY